MSRCLIMYYHTVLHWQDTIYVATKLIFEIHFIHFHLRSRLESIKGFQLTPRDNVVS